jgi:hypothetical protein
MSLIELLITDKNIHCFSLITHATAKQISLDMQKKGTEPLYQVDFFEFDQALNV